MKLTDLFFWNKPRASDQKAEVEERLVHDEPTAGYQGRMALSIFGLEDAPPIAQYFRDMFKMRLSPHVNVAMEYFAAGVQGATFIPKCRNPRVAKFGVDQLKRLWLTGLQSIQEGYWSGFQGLEVKYRIDDDGMIAFDRFNGFNPNDVKLLKRDHNYCGIRIYNVPTKTRPVSLWSADVCGLSKAFWYVHRGRYGSLYGTPQPLGAWRPWRRLEGPDGGETIVDAAVYRFGFAGAKVFFPPRNAVQAERQPPGMERWDNRTQAMRMGEAAKAGMTVALPSVFHEKTGNRMWDMEQPDHTINVDSLVSYNKSLEDQVVLGCGVPPELIKTSEAGSAYSGREIPLEAYFSVQQRIGNDIVHQFVVQVLLPLIRWNFGEHETFDAELANLLEQRVKRTQQQGGAAPENRADTTMAHAPAGGIAIAGEVFAGGQFIPGEVMAKATQQQRQQIESSGGGQAIGGGAKVLVVPGAEPISVYVNDGGKPSQVWPAALPAKTPTKTKAKKKPKSEPIFGGGGSIFATTTPLPDDDMESIVNLVMASMGNIDAKLLSQLMWVANSIPLVERWDWAQTFIEQYRASVTGGMATAILAAEMGAWRRVVESVPETLPLRPAPPVAMQPIPAVTTIELDVIDEAYNYLASRNAMTTEQFAALQADAASRAFTVAGVEDQSTVNAIRHSLAEAVAEGESEAEWAGKLRAQLQLDPFLSPEHRQTVFRNAVHSAYSVGQERVLATPGLGSYFPFRAYEPIAYPHGDGRNRDTHLALGHSGIDGTNIYYGDDPTWDIICPPNDFGDRCGWYPCTVQMAADAGVAEAKTWHETGNEPVTRTWVPMPDGFPPSSGYIRNYMG